MPGPALLLLAAPAFTVVPWSLGVAVTVAVAVVAAVGGGRVHQSLPSSASARAPGRTNWTAVLLNAVGNAVVDNEMVGKGWAT